MFSPKSPSMPLTVVIKPTKACNLNCIHCYDNAGVRLNDELSSSEVKKLIDDLAAVSVPHIHFSGGELLLKQDIFEIIRHASDHDIFVSLSTNGLLMTKEIASKLKESGVKEIALSLDGSNAATHDFIRKGEAFQKTIRAMGIIGEVGLPFNVVTVLMKNNFKELPGIVDLCSDLNVQVHKTSCIIGFGRAKDHFSELALSFEEINYCCEMWKKLRESHADELMMVPDTSFAAMLGPEYQHFFSYFGCPAAFSLSTITPNGDVTLCPLAPSIVVGNVRRTPYRDIWLEAPLLKAIRERTFKGRCEKCEHLQRCGGCRARAYQFHQDLFAEDPYCWKILNKDHLHGTPRRD